MSLRSKAVSLVQQHNCMTQIDMASLRLDETLWFRTIIQQLFLMIFLQQEVSALDILRTYGLPMAHQCVVCSGRRCTLDVLQHLSAQRVHDTQRGPHGQPWHW